MSVTNHSLLTLAAQAQSEELIKKSRFVVYANHAESADKALDFVGQYSRHDATHNCWAYRTGQHFRFNDDGEPSGTAGRPILAAIDAKGLDQTVVLVVRYFGGIKLGAGGLIRAYGGCTARCLAKAKLETRYQLVHAQITAHFDCIGTVSGVLSRQQLKPTSERYTDFGLVLNLEMKRGQVMALQEQLTESTRGRVQVIVSDTPSRDSA